MNAQEWQETSPYANLPCREFCNHKGRGCEPGRCASPYPRSDPRHYLGRGDEPVVGQPFGWAHNAERDAIRAHLRRRLWRFGLDGMAAARLEFRVTAIQQRLRRAYQKRKPPMGVRRVTPREITPPQFTREELAYLVDLFAGANSEIAQQIAAKAQKLTAYP